MRFFRDLALVLVAVLAAALIIEGGLRLAHARYEGSVYQSELERGYGLRPHAAGWSTSESQVWIEINSDGMRDREHTLTRSPDTLRVAMLDASEVESLTVPLAASVVTLMERRLDSVLRPERKHAEVLNFGVAGYTFSQDYLTLKNHVWKYNPQIVIVTISPYQILLNTRALFPGPTSGTPFYQIQNGHLVPDAETRAALPPNPRRQLLKNRLSDWMNHSNLLSLLNAAGRVNLPKRLAAIKAKFAGIRVQGAGRWPPPDYLSTWPYLPDLPETQTSWAIAEAFIDEMKQESDRHATEFWLVILDMGQSHPDISKRNALAQKLGISSLDEADHRFERFCETHHIRVLPLAPPLAEYAASHHLAIRSGPGHVGHWNELGHQLAARVITDTLVRDSPTLKLWIGKVRGGTNAAATNQLSIR
jgi:hypothetical protein